MQLIGLASWDDLPCGVFACGLWNCLWARGMPHGTTCLMGVCFWSLVHCLWHGGWSTIWYDIPLGQLSIMHGISEKV